MIYHPNNYDELEKLMNNEKCLLDFYATWCGPCKMLTPVLEDIDTTNAIGDVKIIKIDIDMIEKAAIQFNIQAVPTLILIEDGKILKTQLGFMNKNQVISFVEK